jgi:HAE1 family hydrophobic/amphiphilic exporter-1
MLMGIVMKNGILLVDYTNALRARGRGLLEAALEAGPVRLRPVLMTTASTVFGMVPVAFGQGDGSEWRNPMGVVCIGGLLTSTFLTLMVVPVVYTLIDEAREVARKALARAPQLGRRNELKRGIQTAARSRSAGFTPRAGDARLVGHAHDGRREDDRDREQADEPLARR